MISVAKFDKMIHAAFPGCTARNFAGIKKHIQLGNKLMIEDGYCDPDNAKDVLRTVKYIIEDTKAGLRNGSLWLKNGKVCHETIKTSIKGWQSFS